MFSQRASPFIPSSASHEIERKSEVKNHGKHNKERRKKNRGSVADPARFHIRGRSTTQPTLQVDVKSTPTLSLFEQSRSNCSDGRFGSTCFALKEREAFLLNYLGVRTLTDRTDDKLVGVRLDQTIERVVVEFSLKNRSSPVNRARCCHFTRQITKQMQRISIQGIGDFLIVDQVCPHSNVAAANPWNLKPLMLVYIGR